MSKAVMISIQPRWCELIAAGEKTMEVRKTRPKLETPFKCYIYQILPKSGDWNERDGRVIGEFACDRIIWMAQIGYTKSGGAPQYRIAEYETWGHSIEPILKEAHLLEKELEMYLKGQAGFGWHISDLKIYDKPKKISEFKKHNRECYFDNLGIATPKCSECTTCNLTKPPQSYCYVEELRT